MTLTRQPSGPGLPMYCFQAFFLFACFYLANAGPVAKMLATASVDTAFAIAMLLMGLAFLEIMERRRVAFMGIECFSGSMPR